MHRLPSRTLLICSMALMAASCEAGKPVQADGGKSAEANVAPAPAKADLQKRLNELKAKTLKNLVFVEGGTFKMGDFGPIHSEDKLQYSPAADDNVLHDVTLDSYSISAYKTTYADFDVYTDATGKPRIAQDKMALEFRNLPGTPAGIGWDTARDYCRWLGDQLKLPMDLPTEAQWEYASRNRGQMVLYATDNGKIDDGRNVASFDQKQAYRQKQKSISALMPVGSHPPNPLGLFDLIGLGYDWTLDWYQSSYTPNAVNNPTGPAVGTERVLRGYEPVGGDSLQLVAFTFVRDKSPPKQPPDVDPEYPDLVLNPDRLHAVRCVVNQEEKITK